MCLLLLIRNFFFCSGDCYCFFNSGKSLKSSESISCLFCNRKFVNTLVMTAVCCDDQLHEALNETLTFMPVLLLLLLLLLMLLLVAAFLAVVVAVLLVVSSTALMINEHWLISRWCTR